MGAETARRGTQPFVLVVARDAAVREAVADVVSELTMTLVITVGTFDEARSELAKARPSALVVDADLARERLDGFLSDLSLANGPPVVLVSTTAAAASIAERHGVAFLRAPFDVDALVGTLDIARGRDSITAQSEKRLKR